MLTSGKALENLAGTFVLKKHLRRRPFHGGISTLLSSIFGWGYLIATWPRRYLFKAHRTGNSLGTGEAQHRAVTCVGDRREGNIHVDYDKLR